MGIYEFQLKTLDRELAELVEEYLPDASKSWEPLKNKQVRVVPVGSAIEHVPVIETYDRVRDLVALQDNIAVAECICRKEQGLLGHECDRPRETCLMFGLAADYYLENGMGRRISRDECLEIMNRAEEAALVLCPTNAQDFINICCCCGCCCGLLRSYGSFERPADHALSSFQARIDPDLCKSCSTCGERCQIGAVVTGEGASRVDPARCIGCGLCVPTCPEKAIRLEAKADAVVPPANFVEISMRILAERGLA
jgi:electron transport complex protein RnfB